MNFDGLGNNTGDLNIDKDMYRLRIKTTLAIIQKMNFEDF